MRKSVFVLVFVFVCFSLTAVTEYDIGGGQTLVLNDDGTYEIITTQIDSARIIGKQYKLALERSLDPLITLAMMEDPTFALLGKDFYYSLIEEMGVFDMVASEIPDFSLVFLSSRKVLLTAEGENPFEANYRISSTRTLFLTAVDGSEIELGTFNENYSEIRIMTGGLPIYLVQQ